MSLHTDRGKPAGGKPAESMKTSGQQRRLRRTGSRAPAAVAAAARRAAPSWPPGWSRPKRRREKPRREESTTACPLATAGAAHGSADAAGGGGSGGAAWGQAACPPLRRRSGQHGHRRPWARAGCGRAGRPAPGGPGQSEFPGGKSPPSPQLGRPESSRAGPGRHSDLNPARATRMTERTPEGAGFTPLPPTHPPILRSPPLLNRWGAEPHPDGA
jgi:hypothetical protein